MTRPRLALLVAAHDGEQPRRNFRRELHADLAEFHLQSGEHPDGFDFDGAVVTGSRASVYGDEAWIAPAREWVREAVDRGLPVLGVCWGHQLLADALGGEVAAMDAYELGYRTIERRGDSRLLEGLDDAFTAFTTHSDEVVELPPGAELLAENDRSIHAFRAGSAHGVQFHPEYDEATALDVTRGKEGLASEDRVERALESIGPDAVAAAAETKRLFDNFLAIVADGRARDRYEARAG